jgi:hypothetical protein
MVCLILLVVALWLTLRPVAQDQAPPIELADGPAWFEDVTAAVGLDFVHDAGPATNYFLPECIGSGAALFDCNNDGLLDIYLLQNAGPGSTVRNRLFLQQSDGRFQDASRGSGLDIAGHNMGVAIGDLDNDGWPDVLVTQYGGLELFLNNGDGTFRRCTEEAGLSNPAWGVSAACVDYDRDGWLDLVVVNYLDFDPSLICTTVNGKKDYCAPQVYPGRAARLFRNLGRPATGKGVRFEDVSLASGIGRVRGPGLGVLCADFDADGWPDLFITNDAHANYLWMNQRDGTFREEAVQRGLAFNGMGQPQGNMGIAVGDVDGDGLFDVFVTHLTKEMNTLWRQGPQPGLFADRTARAGLARPRWNGTGFGTVLGDFDQDGALDLAIVNGRVGRGEVLTNPRLGAHWGWYAERNQLFANDGSGHFRDISLNNPAFCGTPGVSRGLAYGVLRPGTGRLDLLVTAVADQVRLFRNVAPDAGHWLLVRALLRSPVDSGRFRDAHGAQVVVRAGGRRWLGLIQPASSYLCSNDPRAHFGLGRCERVEALEVQWPDGSRECFPGGAADQERILRQGEGDKVTR